MTTWLILGGGTAGAYLAWRLLVMYPQCKVTIIEAGDVTSRWDDPNIRSADKIGSVMNNSEYVRTIKAPEGDVAHGSCIGGGSSVNGAYAVYPSDDMLKQLRQTQVDAGDTGIYDWITIRDYMKGVIPTTEVPTGKAINDISKILDRYIYINPNVIPDTFFKQGDKRISSVTFLEMYRNDPRLTIHSHCTVQRILGKCSTNEDTCPGSRDEDGNSVHVQVLNAKFELVEFVGDKVIMCCGAGTPEIFLKSNSDFYGGNVLCHTGVQLTLNTPLNDSSGQIFTQNTSIRDGSFKEQILVYGNNVHIFNLAPDVGWIPKLASRGEIYYSGHQMSEQRQHEFNDIVSIVKTTLENFKDVKIISTKTSMTYHMVGGCQNIVNNFQVEDIPGLYIVDLSILPAIPDGNTAFMAFMVAEKFMQELGAKSISI
jgi:hypothetical protein